MNREAIITSFIKIQEAQKEKDVSLTEALDIIMTEICQGKPPTTEQIEQAEKYLKELEDGRK